MARVFFDAHQDLAQYPQFNGSNSGMRETTIDDLRRVGAGLVTASIYPLTKSKNVTSFIMAKLANFLDIIYSQPSIWIIGDWTDLKEHLEINFLCFLLHLEGLDYIDKIEQIKLWHGMGIRSAGLVWQKQNAVATPCNVDDDSGLSPLGIALIERMQELGMIVDLAHINRRSFFEALEVATKPVIFSHGNCRALCDQPRNLTDDQLKALKEQGGIFCLSFYKPFIKNAQKVRLADLVAHFEHALEIMGEDHVAIGSDFGGMMCKKRVAGLRGVYEISNLFDAFKKRGFSQDLITKIAQGNLRRFYQEVL